MRSKGIEWRSTLRRQIVLLLLSPNSAAIQPEAAVLALQAALLDLKDSGLRVT